VIGNPGISDRIRSEQVIGFDRNRQLTPWIARVRLVRLRRRQSRQLALGEHANWQVWAEAGHDRRLWRSFLAEQRALLRELRQLTAAVPVGQAPVLLLTDPADRLVPVGTACDLMKTLPDARIQLVEGAGHHLPRRAPAVIVEAVVTFLTSLADRGTSDCAASHPQTLGCGSPGA
jgi:pimeloyl-ACP methyl ester carboxylesterase